VESALADSSDKLGRRFASRDESPTRFGAMRGTTRPETGNRAFVRLEATISLVAAF
jgi:hypothetical protein